ncbi:hypothetical protein WLV06_05450, partial [Bordetella bronchiseptica]
GKPFDTIRGDRVRYNEKTGIYQALGGPNSSAAGGRVRSLAAPRAKAGAGAGGAGSTPGEGRPSKVRAICATAARAAARSW